MCCYQARKSLANAFARDYLSRPANAESRQGYKSEFTNAEIASVHVAKAPHIASLSQLNNDGRGLQHVPRTSFSSSRAILFTYVRGKKEASFSCKRNAIIRVAVRVVKETCQRRKRQSRYLFIDVAAAGRKRIRIVTADLRVRIIIQVWRNFRGASADTDSPRRGRESIYDENKRISRRGGGKREGEGRGDEMRVWNRRRKEEWTRMMVVGGCCCP